MIAPGVTINSHGYIANVSAAGVTPASFQNGIPLDSNGKICIATNAVSGTDTFSMGLRFAANGSIRGSVSGGSGTNFVNGLWLTDDCRLRISNGDASTWDHVSNGDPHVTSGRLALSY